MSESQEQGQRMDTAPEKNLEILYRLQGANSEIDRRVAMLGDLPREVEDLEDEIEGLHTRAKKLQAEMDERTSGVTTKRHEIRDFEAKIKKYKEQLDSASNDREYESLNKEIEYLNLEIDFRNKKIKDAKARNEQTSNELQVTQMNIDAKQVELEAKKGELEDMKASMAKDMETLQARVDELKVQLPLRLQQGYDRIRKSTRDGRAVVAIRRGACGGCWNRIPPQKQLDIRLNKKLIVCEYCGRIIVYDPNADETELQSVK